MKTIIKSYLFNSEIKYGKKNNIIEYNTDDIKSEPMLFSCDYQYARKLGGRLTNEFLNQLINEMPSHWNIHDLIIDSRVHMLFPGFYPAIPGWHHDSVLRTREDKQPNYQDNNKAEHCMLLLNTFISPTQFFVGTIELSDVPIGTKIYKVWSTEIEKRLPTFNPPIITAPDNRLVFFNWETFHKASPATKNGWRFFIRASFNDRSREPANEVRKQTQVYILDESEGW